jgi:hypothetical protein
MPYRRTETKAGQIYHAKYKSLLNDCLYLVKTGGAWLELSYGIPFRIHVFSLTTSLVHEQQVVHGDLTSVCTL